MKNFKTKDLLVTIHPSQKTETLFKGAAVLHGFDGGGGKCVSPSKAGRLLACDDTSKDETCTDVDKSKCPRPISKPHVCELNSPSHCPHLSVPCHEPSTSPKCEKDTSRSPHKKEKKMLADAAALQELKKAVLRLQQQTENATAAKVLA